MNKKTTSPDLSVVVPVYNEVPENLHSTVDRISRVMREQSISFELIFVNDGSQREDTCRTLTDLATHFPFVRVVNLSRNFGECAAISAGLDHARGRAVVNLDSDLQDPPELIPLMYSHFQDGYDIVFTRQAARSEGFIRRLCASWFYRILRASTTVDVPLDSGEFRLMSRRAVDALRALPEKRRFLRGLVPLIGFKQVVVPFVRNGREIGDSSYSVTRLVALAIEAFLSLSFSPLVLIAFVGLAMVFGGILLAVLKVIVPACILICCGVNVLACTVVGAYVAVTLTEVRARPTYIVAEVLERGATGSVQHESAENTAVSMVV